MRNVVEDVLVDIHTVNPRIILDIRYATDHNIAGTKLYPAAKAYLRKSVAVKLSHVQSALEKKGMSLKVWDAYRPLSVQYQLWNLMPDERYVANPFTGSDHNKGCAVDVTLTDAWGNDLEMPTGFDDFSSQAHLSSTNHAEHVIANRDLLVKSMIEHDFQSFATEWWHYTVPNASDYSLETISFDELENLSVLSSNHI